MSGSKFFATTKKGEIYEIKADLNGDDRLKIKNAVKKVIANMTIGKDVSSLFPDVIKNMQTDDIELKKLVYLYLMNYAKSQPEIAILAVNTFVKDSEDMSNPLLRALAIRTMGCIRVDRIVDYLSIPLNKTLADPDPYVRKTAVLAVAKMFDINPSLCEAHGYISTLRNIVTTDANPMVVANAVAALTEMNEDSNGTVFQLNQATLNKLLTVLNDANEWGQIVILDALSKYTTTNPREAENICERVLPRVAHANAAVVLTAVRVLLRFAAIMDKHGMEQQLRAVYSKLGPPLASLLSNEPEVQYVALRCIRLILRRLPSAMTQDIRVFFCKYNDTPYVKREKLDIIVRLATEKNVAQVLSELKEYALEADVEFTRHALEAVGHVALRLGPTAAERAVSILMELIRTRVSHVVQDAIVVIKDIFRKYPNRYELVIPTLCDNLESLDEPMARASIIWIIGEYGERIENVTELLTQFLDTFAEDAVVVQLQLLTAVVKVFLKLPSVAKDLVQRVLQLATTASENSDLRDRGYIYWRLLSSDPSAAKSIVLSERAPISLDIDDDLHQAGPALLDDLIANIGNLASVYHVSSASLVDPDKVAPVVFLRQGEGDESVSFGDAGQTPGEGVSPAVGVSAGPSATGTPAAAPKETPMLLDLLSLDDPVLPAAGSSTGGPATTASGLEDLLGLSISSTPAPTASKSPASGGIDDLLGLMSSNPAPAPAAVTSGGSPPHMMMGSMMMGGSPVMAAATPAGQTVVLQSQLGLGLEVAVAFERQTPQDDGARLGLTLTNRSGAPIDGVAISLGKNSFGMAIHPADRALIPAALAPGQQAALTLRVVFGDAESRQRVEPADQLTIGIRSGQRTFTSTAISVPFERILAPTAVADAGPGAAIPAGQYASMWAQVAAGELAHTVGQLPHLGSVARVVEHLNAHRFFVSNTQKSGNLDVISVSVRIGGVLVVLSDIALHPSMTAIKALIRTPAGGVAPLFASALERVMRSI